MTLDLSKVLKEETNAKIIWFLRESERKYSEILKHLSERDSGKFNYHLQKLIANGIVKKENDSYSLTKNGIKYALYVDSLQLKEKYPLPVVIVAIKKNNKILLAKRCREPNKNQWGLPGNEILYGESPEQAASREIKLELGLDTFNEKIYGVYPTIYKEKEDLLYHVILIAVNANVSTIPHKAKVSGKISEYQFFTLKQLSKLSLIPSNKKPILDAFSNRNVISCQDLQL